MKTKEQRRQYDKEWYQRTKSWRQPKLRAAIHRIKKRNFFIVREYLESHPCITCGETDPIVLDFDHRDSSTKIKAISHMMAFAGTDTIKAEIAKCDVRCANCHRRKTAIELNWYSKFQDTPSN